MYRAPMIYVIFLWQGERCAPPYFADTIPDAQSILTAYPQMTQVSWSPASVR